MTLFFTLSGFVITYNYLDFGWDKTPFGSFGRFAWLRFSRLYPTLLVFVLLTINPLSLATLQQHPFDIWLAVHLLNVEAWAPIRFGGVLPINGAFGVIWSVSTEFMLYFMFALTVILGHRFHRRGQATFLVALVAAVGASLLALAFIPALRPQLYAHLWQPIEPLAADQWDNWFFYLSPYFRVTNFAFGAAAAWVVMHRHELIAHHQIALSRFALGAALLLIGLHLFVTIGQLVPPMVSSYLPVTELVTALLFAIIMLDGESDTAINRALSSRALVALGTISYSLYLFHQILPHLGSYQPGGAFSWWTMPRFAVTFGLFLLLAVAFAYGAWHIIERPAQRYLRSLLPPRRGRAAAPVAVGAE